MKNYTNRKGFDQPLALKAWGWKYHHLGIPITRKMPDEHYLPKFKLYITGFKTSPFGVEWMRFEKDSPVVDLVQKIPHLAFEVDNIDYELDHRKFKVLIPPNSPAKGIKVAMIEHHGAPIELIEFEFVKS
jgi:hypothetical protein